MLPGILKKQGADVLVTIDNLEIPRTSVPVCLVITSVPASAEESSRSAKLFFKRFSSAARRMQAMIGFSRADVLHLRQKEPASTAKIIHLQLSVRHSIRPFTMQQREAAREQYASGLEYFAFAGDLGDNHQLTGLLRAFSSFKKWQRSNMRLVIAGNRTAQTGSWLTSLENYKYRDEVRVIEDPSSESLHAVIAGAYAFVYPALHNHLPVNVLHAMQAGVPVITSSIPVITEIASQAVLYAAPNDENGFAAAMQAIYKDEQLHDSLISKGSLRVAETVHDLADDCWHILSRLSLHKSP